MSRHHSKGKGGRRQVYIRRRRIKKELITENGKKCGYCFRLQNKKDLTLDHIQPLCKGGTDTKDNMILACKECNEVKGSMDIDEWINHLGWEL